MGFKRLFKNTDRQGSPTKFRRFRILSTMPLVFVSISVIVGVTDITALIAISKVSFLFFGILCFLETTPTIKSIMNMISPPTERQVMAKVVIVLSIAIASFSILFSATLFQYLHLQNPPQFVKITWYLFSITTTIYCAGFLSNIIFGLQSGQQEMIQNTSFTSVILSITLPFAIGLYDFTN